MPRRVRDNESKDETQRPTAASFVTNEQDSGYAGPDSLFTFRMVQEPLLLSNVASTLRAVSRLYTKLWLIHQNYASDVVAYATTHDTGYADQVQLTVARITQNSPLTVVVMVSEALGKALASLIDAVTQTPQRYQWARQQVEYALQENQAQLHALKTQTQIQSRQSRMQAREHELALQERQLALQAQLLQVKMKEVQLRESQVNMQMHLRNVALQQALLEVERLNPSASLEARKMMAQALMEEILELSSSTGLVVESVWPRESA